MINTVTDSKDNNRKSIHNSKKNIYGKTEIIKTAIKRI